MIIWEREPTLAELLSDPLIEIVMRADGVDPDALRPDLCAMARELGRRGVSVAQGCACD